MSIQQLVIDFPCTSSYSPSTFMVTPSNQEAYDWITRPSQWHTYGTLLSGEIGCGKTHLAHIWQQHTHAHFIRRHELEGDLSQILPKASAFILEDIENYQQSQTALFHLLNTMREEQKQILLTTERLPDEKLFYLKDLLSRLRALPCLYIQSPDDHLLKAIMLKRFSDLQIHVEDKVIQYVILRTERSFSTLHHLIDQIYQTSLAHKHKPTVSLLKGLC